MQTVRITTSQNIDIDYELAGLGERIVASIIDFGIFFLLYILFIITGISLDGMKSTLIVLIVIYGIAYVFYDLVCEYFMNGQSVGKKVMKIKVVSLDGAQPRFSQYLLRWLFRIIDFGVSFGSIALVVAAISEKVQRIGDLVAGTILIRTSPRTKINHVAFMPAADGYEPVFAAAAQLSEQDIELINEVVNTYVKTGNSVVVYNMATRIKNHLGVAAPPEMNDLKFLQTLRKDYSFYATQAEVL
ncbi:RDD family protein [Mucilaginibacter sp.]|uniref:RDD family protein n=1 Tax=Mucilaginibacter sp. TaxID=1882438 RepID=UPI003265071D